MLGGAFKIDLEMESHAVVLGAESNTWIDLADVEFPFLDLLF